MIHYTLLNPEIIWSDYYEKPVPLEEHTIDGIHLVMRRLNEQTWRVEQILSTDPMDFLHPRFQPGSLFVSSPHPTLVNNC